MKATPSIMKIEFLIEDAGVTEIKKGVFVVPTAVRVFYFYSTVSKLWMIRSVEVYQDSDQIKDFSQTNVELDDWHRVSCDIAPVWLKSLIIDGFPAVVVRGEFS